MLHKKEENIKLSFIYYSIHPSFQTFKIVFLMKFLSKQMLLCEDYFKL